MPLRASILSSRPDGLLELSRKPLGPTLDASGVMLEVRGVCWRLLGAHFGALGAASGALGSAPGTIFGGFWVGFGSDFEVSFYLSKPALDASTLGGSAD